MDSYQRLLVVIDEHDFSLKGISRALYMASRTNAVVIVMLLQHGNFVSRLVDTFEQSDSESLPNTKHLTIEKKRQCINEFIKSTCQSGLSISQAAINCTSCDDVLTFCDDFKVDAVFIAASRHKLWNWLTIKALDIRLIRESTRPVVVVKDHLWEPGGRIISLIEPCTEDIEHKELNETVLQTTAHFTQLLKGDCHLVDCYFGETPSISFHQAMTPESNEGYHFEQMSKYTSQYHLLPSNVKTVNEHFHLAKELPEDAIESLSKRVDSELVILGDKGTPNLLSNLCGNVAEQVIDRINCDLLVVKKSSSAFN
ncbi:universal stress protein [Shewanella sp. Isolate11]|uniref:universal stress protein n=1 Tax=Shewanella sp. Isolate11 TaxID=2908530 RepID=UPI001EFECDF9|nr:universal stress protein [Shewanella sp. Isolate11]MCG9696819.1 universal stress protein [Shewanella sp. Isolate11]